MNGNLNPDWPDLPKRFAQHCDALAVRSLLQACKDVLAAIEQADLGGEVLWINRGSAVHETASERLRSVICETIAQSEPLENLEESQLAKPRWLEASSYLPYNSDPVLVFGVHRNGDIDRKVWLGYFSLDDDRWYAESGIEIGDVTHWASRPKGPT